MSKAQRIAMMKTSLASGGRVVIPAEYRRALGLRTGDELLLELMDGEVRILTRRQAVKRAQEFFRAGHTDDGRVDELIA